MIRKYLANATHRLLLESDAVAKASSLRKVVTVCHEYVAGSFLTITRTLGLVSGDLTQCKKGIAGLERRLDEIGSAIKANDEKLTRAVSFIESIESQPRRKGKA